MTNPGGVFITQREFWGLLNQIATDVSTLKERDSAGAKRDQDVEDRLRSLEKWRWLSVGAAAVAGSGTGAILQQMLT